MSAPCPELEQLFEQLAEAGSAASVPHAQECAACAALLEEHRQLEKDLFRIADPLPPPELVRSVMAAVALRLVPVAAEVRAGLSILAVTVSASAFLLFRGGHSLADVGTGLAQGLLHLRAMLIGLGSAANVLWTTAGLAVAISLALVLFASLFGLKKLVQVSP